MVDVVVGTVTAVGPIAPSSPFGAVVADVERYPRMVDGEALVPLDDAHDAVTTTATRTALARAQVRVCQ